MRKLIPTRWHVIVKDLGSVKRIRHIIMPDGVDREIEARFGEVIAVGDECFTGKFSCFKDITKGSLIAYGQRATSMLSFKWEHENLNVILDEDVLALITGDTETQIREELADEN